MRSLQGEEFSKSMDFDGGMHDSLDLINEIEKIMETQVYR